MDFTIQVAAAAVVVLAAALDIISQRIPNWLTLGGAVAGLVLHTISSGLPGLLFASGGLVVGFLLLIGFYAAGGMAAGDVKLLAALGALLGREHIFWIFLYGAALGGLYAVALLVVHSFRRAPAGDAGAGGSLLKSMILSRGDLGHFSRSLRSYPKLRYAVAIGAGVAVRRIVDGPL